MDKIIDDDAGTPDEVVTGIGELVAALHLVERRRKTRLGVLYLALVMVGILVSGTIFFAQISQIRTLQAKAYTTCLNRVEQMKAELILLHAISDSATGTVHSAAELSLETFPAIPDCSQYR